MIAKHIIIRTDASTQIGSGHVMRCLALAEAWQDIVTKNIVKYNIDYNRDRDFPQDDATWLKTQLRS